MNQNKNSSLEKITSINEGLVQSQVSEMVRDRDCSLEVHRALKAD